MAFRFRKSFKIAPGVKFNLNKKSASMTFGGKGLSCTVNTKGKKTKNPTYTKQKDSKPISANDTLLKIYFALLTLSLYYAISFFRSSKIFISLIFAIITILKVKGIISLFKKPTEEQQSSKTTE